MQRFVLLAAVGLMLAMPARARAVGQEAPSKLVRLKVRSVVGLARTQAPQTVEISLDCDQGKLYEGRLELKWYAGHALVHEFHSHEITLSAAGQRLRLTLPTIPVYSKTTNVTVYGRFLTERGVIDLGEVDADLPLMTQRTLVVGTVQPQEFARAQFERGITEALGLEQFNPYADAHFDLLTYSMRVTPEELSMVAAGYVGFDMLVLEGEGFRRLRRGQLAAIGQWVSGGGSVVVAPTGALTAAHVEFLNRLAGLPATPSDAASRAAYALDEGGRLVVEDQSPVTGRQLAHYYAGLGRAVVMHQPLDPRIALGSREWKETVAFLWKMRAAQRDAVTRTGGWSVPPPPPRVPGAPSLFAPERDDLVRSIRQVLMPERIVGVPFSVVAVILSLFLLAVAPGDYFLLGRLNCRKYTWWLFVLISATFTVCTVIVAESYVGRNDYRTALVFVDIDEREGEEGRPAAALARTSRFELQFVSTQRTVEKPLRNCLYADLTDGADIQDSLPFQDRPFGTSEAEELDLKLRFATDLPVHEGAMPGAFTVHQQLRQWSPRITRETAIGDDRSLLSETRIDWSALPTAGLQSPQERRTLFDSILAREPEAQVLLLHGKWAYDPAHNEDAPPGTATEGMATTVLASRGGPWVPKTVNVPASAESSPAGQAASSIVLLAARASKRGGTGLFAVLSQIAPTGGLVLEDLALLDDSDPQQWLLIVAVRRENTWLVFRKICRATTPFGGR